MNFGITNWWFIAALGIVAVGLGVGTALTWEWRRFRLVRRIGGLFATQIMVTLTAAAVINMQADFYATTGEVVAALGGSTSNAPHVLVPTAHVGAIAADAHISQPWEHQHSGRQHGLLVDTTIRGRRTGYALPAEIYLPGAYFAPNERHRRFPVVELTDGYPGSPQIWLHDLDLASVLNHLIDTRKMPPMIVVLPTQNPNPGRDSECVDAVDGAQAGTYISQDVPDAIARQFRTAPTRSGWGIMGYSTGGFCAVNAALHNPGRFSAAGSLSGYFTPLTDITTGNLYRDDSAARLANTPLDMVDHHSGGPMSFYLFASKSEKSGHEVRDDQQFAARIRRPDRVQQVVVPVGGHNFQTWGRELPQAFGWIGHTLRA